MQVTTLLAVPPMMVQIANSTNVTQYDTSSVCKIFCGAAPLAPSLCDEVRKKLINAHVVQGIGLRY